MCTIREPDRVSDTRAYGKAWDLCHKSELFRKAS
jgi:hypothetical protein